MCHNLLLLAVRASRPLNSLTAKPRKFQAAISANHQDYDAAEAY